MSQQTSNLPINSSLRRKLIMTFWILVGVAAFLGLFIWWFTGRHYRRTHDCYVEGNSLVITPLVDGFITTVQTDETYLVEKKQLLVTLDRTNALISFREAKENLASTVREVCKIYHQAFAYQSEIKSQYANFIKADKYYNHRLAVIEAGAVSLEDLQAWQANLEESYNNYEQARQLYQKESSLIQGTTLRNNPLILAAIDRLTQAWVNLYRCNVYAPERGIIAQRSAHVGKWVKAGEPLLNIIPLEQIWVNANFKETQMRHMKIGQKVKIYADMYGRDVVYHGRIVGLPGGAGNAFSILPPQNLSGNWIKIVQRLPVRVMIDPKDLIEHPLRIGMTLHATVDIRDPADGFLPTNNKNAPTYRTQIYKEEVVGAKEQANNIFAENLDKNLETYVDQIFEPKNFESVR